MDTMEILQAVAAEFDNDGNTVEFDEAGKCIYAFFKTKNHKKFRLQITAKEDAYGNNGFITEVFYMSAIVASGLIMYDEYNGEFSAEQLYSHEFGLIDEKRSRRQVAEILNWAEIAVKNTVVPD